jgi:hypothetical protein
MKWLKINLFKKKIVHNYIDFLLKVQNHLNNFFFNVIIQEHFNDYFFEKEMFNKWIYIFNIIILSMLGYFQIF